MTSLDQLCDNVENTNLLKSRLEHNVELDAVASADPIMVADQVRNVENESCEHLRATTKSTDNEIEEESNNETNEVYIASDASDGSRDELHIISGDDVTNDLDSSEDSCSEDFNLESAISKLLEHINDSADDDLPRVSVDKAVAKEVTTDLLTNGTLYFLDKYLLSENRRYTVPELLAAIGVRLPINVVEDPQFEPHHFEIALQVAIRYVLKNRPRLPSPRTLDDVVELIQKSQRILVVTGAGISTSLGIPDFRSDNGLYAQLAHLGLSDPQEVFDITMFRHDPSIFYSVAAKILPDKKFHGGTPTHKFIKLLNDHGKLLRNYTQNIDNLEYYVGIDPERLVQCHGSFGSAHCFTCGYEESEGANLFDTIKNGEIPRCPECAKRARQGKRKRKLDDDDNDEYDDPSIGVMKPDITFFGESLPPRFDRMLLEEGDADKCDLVICMGTSLRVSPVSEIIKVVGRDVPQIYISKTPAKHCNFEVVFLGGCDETCELLCDKLEWDLDHAMAKRIPGMKDNEWPGGHIESADGIYRFISD